MNVTPPNPCDPIVCLDGLFLPESDASIPVSDRGFLYGDGVYVTVKVEGGRPVYLKEHLARLRYECLAFDLNPPKVDPSFVVDLIAKNRAETGVWRLKIVVTGGSSSEAYLPKREYGHLLITLKPNLLPTPQRPLYMGVYPLAIQVPHHGFKSLAHLNRYFVSDYAKKQGYDDAIGLTPEGYILEASFGNLFWQMGDLVETPCSSLPLYFGVTIEKVLERAEALGMKTRYVKKKVAEIPEDAFVFRTNSIGGLCPIGGIDRRRFRMKSHPSCFDLQLHAH